MAAGRTRDAPMSGKIAQKSSQALCFLIGAIGREGSEERKHSDLLLNTVVRHVLEDDEFQYRVKRADEDADPGMIGSRILVDLVAADLVVADLTNLNANAFYELAIRHVSMRPAIHIAKAGTLLPFDNAGNRTVFVDLTDWTSIQQARLHLARSARVIREPGYTVTNPISQAFVALDKSSQPKIGVKFKGVG